MATKSAFSRLSGRDRSSILPFHNTRQMSEHHLDELEPRADDQLLSTDYDDHDSPDQQRTSKPPLSSNRKPTGARNRRPSNASSGGSASKTRRGYAHDRDAPTFIHGIPPPIAVSRVLYRDQEHEQSRDYNDHDEEESPGLVASWLPGAISMFRGGGVRSNLTRRQESGEQQITAYDQSSNWKSLVRREKSLQKEVRWYMERLDEAALKQQDGDDSISNDGAATTARAVTASMRSSQNLGHSLSFLQPQLRWGPNSEIVPVRQPQQKKIGLNEARRGISRCMTEFAHIKAVENALVDTALSTRKQALVQLQQLASRQQGIVEELEALESDKEEPLKLELEDLENEHREVCIEIQDLEKRLKALRSRKRHMERRMVEVTNQREAGLSGYKNALREVKDSVKDFLASPPVKPLDLETMNKNNQSGSMLPASPGGEEFLHLLPGRRTIDMARDWWEAEVAILENRKAILDKERDAYDEGGQIWDETIDIVHQCENMMRKNMGAWIAESDDNGKGKGKDPEMRQLEALRRYYNEIASVVTALDERFEIVKNRDWHLLLAAIGIERWAFISAAKAARNMLHSKGITIDENSLRTPAMLKEESGTTGSHNSFHSVEEGSELLDLPNNHEDEAEESDDNEVPRDLLSEHNIDDKEDSSYYEKGQGKYVEEDGKAQTTITSYDGAHNDDNEVPPEFLAEVQKPRQHDGHSSDNEVPPDLLVEQEDRRG